MGRTVVALGTPGRALMRVACEDAGIRTTPRDDDVVRAAGVGQLRHDGIEDRVRGDRSRQARQDPGERFGLFAAADLELGRPPAMTDGGEADEERRGWQRPVHRSSSAGPRAGGPRSGRGRRRSRRRSTKRVACDAPRSRGIVRRTVGLAHVRYRGWGTRAPASIPGPSTHGSSPPVLRTSRALSDGSRCRVPGCRGVVAALPLDAVQRRVGRRDELGGGPPVAPGRSPRRSTRRSGRARVARRRRRARGTPRGSVRLPAVASATSVSGRMIANSSPP